MALQETVDQIVDLLHKRGGHEDDRIAADDRLEAVGLDSIDLAYLLSYFERTHDVDFDDDDYDLGTYQTVADIAKIVEARIDG